MEKTDVGKGPTIKDTAILARISFLVSFWDYARRTSEPRKEMAEFVKLLKRRGVSEETINSLRETMSGLCDDIETQKK